MAASELHLSDKKIFKGSKVNEATELIIQPLRKHLQRYVPLKSDSELHRESKSRY